MTVLFNNRAWSTWTSLFFLIPAFLAYTQNKLGLVVLLATQTLFSILYHLKKPDGPDWWWRRKKLGQHMLQITDTILAIIISIHVFAGILNTRFNVFSFLIIASGVLSLYIFFRRRKHYESFHGLWHVTASLTVLLWLLFV